MPCNVLPQQTFLPLDSIRLGRLVLSVDKPEQDYFDPPCEEEIEFSVTTQRNYADLQESVADRDLFSILTRLVSASISKREKTYVQVTSTEAKKYILFNSGTWLKLALRAEATRSWIGQAIHQGHDVYMVVGYHTLLDAHIVEGSAAVISRSVQLATAEAQSTPTAIGASEDPSDGGQRQFVAADEQVCAVQYRKVRFRWLSSRDLDLASLDKNQWKIQWNVRGQETGTNDVVEAELQDELELEEDYEIHHSDTDGIFVINIDKVFGEDKFA